jgi:hypothetical protein
MLLGINRKDAKGVMDFIVCQQVLPFISVERDEVERPNIPRKAAEPGRAPRPSFRMRAWHSWFLPIAVSRVNRCSHGAVSPCCQGATSPGASAQRGGYNQSLLTK